MPILTLRQFLATTCLAMTLLNVRGANLPGDFLDEDGNYLGSDGRMDHKLYVIRMTDTESFDGVPYLGIDTATAGRAKQFIHDHSGNRAQFLKNAWIDNNVVSIESVSDVRREMVRWVSQDNGGCDTVESDNKEYGGLVSNQNKVIRENRGQRTHPNRGGTISMGLLSFGIEIAEFHSHPSGMENGIGYAQPPSNYDWRKVQNRKGYVFAMRTKIVYIYDRRGVLAKLPLDRFAKYK